ncbi:hypothetical protein Trydic_g12898 [Trypoxylus dichotomus]
MSNIWTHAKYLEHQPTISPKCANCQREHLSTYISCPTISNNAAVNKKFIDAAPLKINPWSKKKEFIDMKNEVEKQSTKEDPVNSSEESEEKLVLVLRRGTDYTKPRTGYEINFKKLPKNLTVDAPIEDTHSYTLTGSTDILDLVILKNVKAPYYLESINDLSSDHLSVIMTVSFESCNIHQTICTKNWQKLEKNLKIRQTCINTDNNIDIMVKQYKEDIILVLDLATTT